jgi:hypothetical protein
VGFAYAGGIRYGSEGAGLDINFVPIGKRRGGLPNDPNLAIGVPGTNVGLGKRACSEKKDKKSGSKDCSHFFKFDCETEDKFD